MVDLVAVVILIWLIGARRVYFPKTSLEKVTTTAIFGLSIWSLFAAFFGSGPSLVSGIGFWIVQVRYLILFLLGASIAQKVGIRPAVRYLVIVVWSHVGLALIQAYNKGPFGLTELGEGSYHPISRVIFGPLNTVSGLYTSGFTGSTRILASMVILLTPVVLYYLIQSKHKFLRASFLACSLGSGTIIVALTGSDAAIASFILMLFAYTGSLLFLVNNYRSRIGVAVSSVCILCVVLIARLSFSPIPESTSSEETSGLRNSDTRSEPGSSGTKGVATGESSSNPEGANQGFLTDLLHGVATRTPFLSTSTLPVRIKQYQAAIRVGLDYPLFGLGGYNFIRVGNEYGSPKGMAVHNTILMYLSSTGFVGMILYLAAVLSSGAVALYQVVKEPHDSNLYWVAVVCGLLGFHAFTFWVRLWDLPTYSTFWVMTGFILGTTQYKTD
jgi:hypothetical protein